MDQAATQTPHVFSVIMPCYNSEAYLRSALDSVCAQSYPHWELIAVNDGSTDATLQILQQYAQNDSRIKIYSKPNGGYVSAVNTGLDHLHGDYFLMMGSDDRLSADLFQKLWETSRQNAPDCIAFRTVIFQDGQNLGVESVSSFPTAVSQFHTTLARFSQEYPAHADIFFTRDTSKCYKTALLGNIRYLGRYGFDADGIFSMMLCHNAHSFATAVVDGYYWTLRGDSLSGRKSFFAQDWDRMCIWTQFFQSLLLRDRQEIAAVEQNFLYYFVEILESVWSVQGRPSPELKQAISTIRAMVKKTGFDLSVSGPSRLLLSTPPMRMLYDHLPKAARRLIQHQPGENC